MLHSVPTQVNKLARSVVINHPNSYNAFIVRKSVTRAATISGGLPTLGGLGVISSDDEEKIEWLPMGNAYALEVEIYSPGIMMDRQDTNNQGLDEFRFLIEPETEIGEDGAFEIKKNDVMYIIVTDTVRLAYEVVAIETTSNIPPYTQRHICNRRNELDVSIVI